MLDIVRQVTDKIIRKGELCVRFFLSNFFSEYKVRLYELPCLLKQSFSISLSLGMTESNFNFKLRFNNRASSMDSASGGL